MLSRNAGLSLLEYVVGLAVLAIILVGAGLFFASLPRQLDPVFQFRAVSLAEALAEQTLALKYDANNTPGAPAGQSRCGSGTAPECLKDATAAAGTEVTDFTHLDDFRLWCGDANAVAGDALAAQLGLSRSELYARYAVNTCVEDAVDADGTPYKQVQIEVQDQNGDRLPFTLHRYNIR